MSGPVTTLGDLLAPYSPDAFLRDDWTKGFRHVKGVPGRFADLMAWPDLNRILAEHELDTPRIRLVKAGQDVSEPPFLRYGYVHGFDSTRVPRIDAEVLSRHLREGATMVLNRVDGLHSPVAALMRDLEHRFGCDVRTNLYAGWRTTEGFNLHWDDHDVMILQVHGRKHWRVYGQTRAHPLRSDIAENDVRPDTPIWDGFLEAGDLLYIPRGFWHVAVPLDEPTLHLTIGFVTKTAEDLIGWMAKKLRADAMSRRDLPRIADREGRRARVAEIRAAFDALWHDDLLDDYFGYQDRNAIRRTTLSLPFATLDDPFAARRDGVLVEWRTARDCSFTTDPDGSLRLKAQGQQWVYAAAAGPLLRHLRKGGAHEVAELCTRFSCAAVSDGQVAELLGSLLHDGLVVATEAPRSTGPAEDRSPAEERSRSLDFVPA